MRIKNNGSLGFAVMGTQVLGYEPVYARSYPKIGPFPRQLSKSQQPWSHLFVVWVYRNNYAGQWFDFTDAFPVDNTIGI
jgi:hypothetical protein